MAYKEVVTKAGSFGGRYFSKIFGFFFIFIFILVPLLYALTISIQAGSLEPGFSYIAPKLIAPVQQLETQSNIAIAQEGTYIRTGHLFGDIWNFLKFYYLLLGSLYVIYKWNHIFFKILPFTPWSSNDSNKMVNVVLAVSIFLFLQIVFLGGIAAADQDLGYWEAVNTPFRATASFIKAFPFFISEANSIVDWETQNNITINPVENITNSTLNNDTNVTDINTTDSSQSSYIIH